MRKMFTSFLIAGILSLGLAGLAFSAVEVKSAGTVVGKTETLNITGPAIAVSGTDVTINTLTETGNKDISGTLAVGTGDAFTVGATGIIIDTSLYATTAGSGGNRTVCVSADGKIFSSATACP